MALKRVTRVTLTVFALTMLPAVARGNPIQIVGNALGCFGLGCTAAEAAAIVIGGVPITFTSAAVDFSGLTDPIDGGLAINTLGTSTTGNFGTISIGTAVPATSVATAFTLLLQFTNPDTPDALFAANLKGTVYVLGSGGIKVDFDPVAGAANVNYTLSGFPYVDTLGGGATGTLNITAYGVAIPSGGQGEITGFIEAIPDPVRDVPEPSSALLLGAGAFGLIAARRRQR